MSGLRIGVIGLGRIGVMHARNLAQTEGVGEVVLIGRSAARVDTARAELEKALAPGAPAALRGDLAPEGAAAPLSTRTTDEGWLEGLDGLVIASSTASHPALMRQAAAAGVPALVEKPIALDLEEFEALAAEFAEPRTPVMVAFHRRYDAGYQELRRRIQAGEAGTVRLIHALSHDHYHITTDYMPGSGGIWRDMVIHDFDALPWLLDEEVVSVYATGAVVDEPAYGEHGDVDTASAILTFASGAQAIVSAGRNIASGHDVRTEVYGSDAAFSAGLDARTPVVSTEPGGPAPEDTYDEFVNRFEPAFRREVAHFLRVIRGEDVSLTPPADGLTAMRIAVAAEESVRRGGPVRIDEIGDAR